MSLPASPANSAAPFPAKPNGAPVALWFILGLVLLRVGYLRFPELFPEESYYWNYARHLDFGYLDHPPMVSWLIHVGTTVFGSHEFGVRISAWLCSLTAGFFIFKLADLLYDRRTAWTALLIAQVLPFFFLTGFMITPDAPLVACWAAMLYFLARIFFFQSTAAWLGVGVALGVGMLSKYTIALLGPATLLFLLLDPPSRVWFRRPAPYLAVLFSIALFSPVIVWNFQHHWASFAFQSADRVAEKHRFSSHELLGSIAAFLTPVGLWLGVRALSGKTSLASDSGALDEKRRRLFLRVFVCVPLSVFVAFSVIHRVKLNWTGPLWVALLPAMAAQAHVLWERKTGLFQWAAIGSLVVLSLGYLGFVQYLSTGLPGVKYSSKTELLPVGWAQMGAALGAQKSELEKAVPGDVLVVGLDRNFIASQAAFYQPDQVAAVRDTTGAHLFGGKSLMYEYWFPLRELDCKTLLLVTFQKHDLQKKLIRERCGTLGPIEEHRLERDGKFIRRYYTRVGYNYRPTGRK